MKLKDILIWIIIFVVVGVIVSAIQIPDNFEFLKLKTKSITSNSIDLEDW